MVKVRSVVNGDTVFDFSDALFVMLNNPAEIANFSIYFDNNSNQTNSNLTVNYTYITPDTFNVIKTANTINTIQPKSSYHSMFFT